MSEKKCFCHLNGYEVKDAQARTDISELHNRVGEIEGAHSNMRNDVNALLAAVDEIEGAHEEDISNMRNDVNALRASVDKLAENDGLVFEWDPETESLTMSVVEA